MANPHILGNTEINDSGVFLYDIPTMKNAQEKDHNIFNTRRYYNNDGHPAWYKILHIGTTGGYGNKSALLHIAPTIGLGGGSALVYFTYYNNGGFEMIRLAGNLFSDRLIAVKDSNNSISLYMKTTDWYRPILVTILSGMFNIEPYLWEGLYNGCGEVSSLPSGTKYKMTLL